MIIPAGVPDGYLITQIGKSNEIIGLHPGDLHIKVNIQNHYLFKRKYQHLTYTHDISLGELLVGTQFNVKQLDGRNLIISLPSGLYKPYDKWYEYEM